jgi:hypothetical protein
VVVVFFDYYNTLLVYTFVLTSLHYTMVVQVIAAQAGKQVAKQIAKQGGKYYFKRMALHKVTTKKAQKKATQNALLRKTKKMAVKGVQDAAMASATDTKGAEGGGGGGGGATEAGAQDQQQQQQQQRGSGRLKKAAMAIGGGLGGGAGLMAARAVTKSEISRGLVKGMHQIPYRLAASSKSHR